MSFPDDEDLHAPAFSVARGFEAYGRYGRDPKKALAALKRRAPAFSEEQRVLVFETFVKLCALAHELIPAHSPPRGGRRTDSKYRRLMTWITPPARSVWTRSCLVAR